MSVDLQFLGPFDTGRRICILHPVLGGWTTFFFPAYTPLQSATFYVHVVSDGPSTLLAVGLPPHWLLLLRCLHPVLQPLPGRWGMVVIERPSLPLHMYFVRCVHCRFQYPLFLRCGGGLNSPLAYLVLLGRGGAIRCLHCLCPHIFGCSHVCGPIHYCRGV